MNWKEEAMDKLRKYDAMRLSLQNLPEEISRLESDAHNLKARRVDSLPVMYSGKRREDALLSNIVERQELQASLEQARSWVKIIDRGLSALDPEEKLVLYRMYIRPEKNSVGTLCSELGVEQSSIYRKRDKALSRFTVALYGITTL